ncbi:MAG: glycosyltransferase [Lachnospiraceae bacterium]|nr:glycosyltransferase [Lachnospiraceae bacterium]
MPKISVIMSTYNEERYIADAVGSILGQTFRDLEFIIIDDASTDRTPEILESINDSRVIFHRNPENLGLTVNLNRALKEAKGEFIARMDGDDISRPKRLEKQLHYMDAHPDVALAGCDTKNFGQNGLIWRLKDDPEELRIRMLLHPVLAHPTFFMRRSLTERGFCYDESFRTAQDYDLASRIAKSEKIGRVPEILLDYRVHEKQVSSVDPSGQSGNAKRVRDRLFSEIGAELTPELTDVREQWAAEICPGSAGVFYEAVRIIGLITEANKKSRIHEDAKLEKTLKKMLCTWLIRTKNPDHLKEAPSILGHSLYDMTVFAGEGLRTVKEKCLNRICH